MAKYSRPYLTLVAFSILIWSACRTRTEQERDRVFYYNESNGITSLDPAFARDIEVMWATNQLFDGLVELDSALQIVPCIAKSWDISSDGLLYTFHLRTDVFFHRSPCFPDSSPRRVNAHDFVYSFQRILDPKVASPGSWIFASVDTSHATGFQAIDDTTLAIHLKERFEPFLGILSMQYCNVVPHEAIDYYGKEFRSHPVGTGAFQFFHWMEDVALVLHRNEHYWMRDQQGRSLPYLDAVKIDFVKDMTVEYQGLIQGRYDFMSGIHPAFKDEILTSDGELKSSMQSKLKFQKVPFVKTDYLGWYVDEQSGVNVNSPWLLPKIRRAISCAIQKEKMIRYLRNNTVFIANEGFIPPVLNPADTILYNSFSLEQAEELLSESGYPHGENLPPLVISCTSDYTDLMEFIQHDLKQIGVEVQIQVLQGPALREQSAKGQLSMFRKSWLADYPDAENFLTVFASSSFCPAGPNYTHYHNPAFDALYASCRTETNPQQRRRLFTEMNAMLMEDCPIIPLYYDQVSHFVRHEVHGLQTNPLNMIDLRTVYKTTSHAQD